MLKKIKNLKLEIILIILFVIMSVAMCDRYSINFDEYYTLSWCRCDWPEFFYEVLHDTSPFLYYFIIRPLALVTGQSILATRLFSIAALFSILLIGSFFVKNFFGQKATYFYLIIIFLNPFMLQKATEIRMYVLASAFTLLSGVFCHQLLLKDTRKNWILFTLFSLLASYTHYYSVLTMIFLYLGLLIYYIATHQEKSIRNWWVCSIVTVICYLPILIIAIFQIKESNGGWIPKPDSRLAPLKELFYSEISFSEYLYLAIIAGFTLFAFISFLRQKTAEFYWSLICCSALWGITAFGIFWGELVKPILLSRYLIMPVCLLFLGICPLIQHTNKYVVLLLSILLIVIGIRQYSSILYSLQNDHTVDTLHFAEENIKDGDKIILLSGDDYLYNCTHYFIPHAELYYYGKFESKLFKKENPDDIFWFFDNQNCMDKELLIRNGLTVKDFGEYQFRHMHINIYKIY